MLADLYGLRAPFLLIAVLVAADAVARIVLIKQLPVHPNPTPLRALARGPQVGLLIALTAVGAAATAFVEPVLPLHLSGLGLGPSGIGLAFGAAALGGAIAAPLAGLPCSQPARARGRWRDGRHAGQRRTDVRAVRMTADRTGHSFVVCL